MPPRSATPDLFAEAPARPRPQTKDWINAHCDGGARGNPGPSGYGALIQDDQGMVIAELSEFLGIRTNNYAEYSGLPGRLPTEARDRGMKRPHTVGQPAPAPLKATPYPTKSEAPPNPFVKADAMLRGFTKDGVVHVLGGATLPDGIFVKIIRE